MSSKLEKRIHNGDSIIRVKKVIIRSLVRSSISTRLARTRMQTKTVYWPTRTDTWPYLSIRSSHNHKKVQPTREDRSEAKTSRFLPFREEFNKIRDIRPGHATLPWRERETSIILLHILLLVTNQQPPRSSSLEWITNIKHSIAAYQKAFSFPFLGSTGVKRTTNEESK